MTTRKTSDGPRSDQRGAFEQLRREVAGEVFLPGDPGWEEARRGWNLAVDQRPAAVVEAKRVDDVQAAVRLAGSTGLRVAPQATGHGAGPLAALDDAILLKTSRMRGVSVRPEARVARVEAGALAVDLAEAAGAHGLAAATGLAPTVGVTGLTLGGGVGWLSRSRGLACNNVRAVELVTPAGERVRVDADHAPELFWALRGGGGGCAIVTALEVELHPVPEVFAGAVMWPADLAADILDQYRAWSADVPESLSSVFRYLALPDVPGVPEPLRGRRVVAIFAAYLGGSQEGERLLRPLRASRTAIVDTFAEMPPAGLVRVAGDPEAPMPAFGHGFMVHGLSADLADAVARRIVDDALAPLSVLELRQLGGALARPPEGHGVLGALEAGFVVFASGVAPDPVARREIAGRLDELRSALTPWKTERELLNWGDLPVDPARAFEGEAFERLRRVHDAHDPDRLVLASRPMAEPRPA
jgi:FAD/FMN-containing dehydrogenase